MQTLIVALLVVAAAAYVAWALLPARWRLRLGLPMRRGGRPTAGGPSCGCHGCGIVKPGQRDGQGGR
jgi:hypothetical protein